MGKTSRRKRKATRKVTEEQVAAMNREATLRNADHRFTRDEDGRLVRVEVVRRIVDGW